MEGVKGKVFSMQREREIESQIPQVGETKGPRTTRKEARAEREAVVKGASLDHLGGLSPKERFVIGKMYPSHDSGDRPTTHRELGNQLGITPQGVQYREKRALQKLRTGEFDRKSRRPQTTPSKIEMDTETRQWMLENRNLPASKVARILEHSEEIIARWRKELNIPKSRPGRPSKQVRA